MFSQVSSVISKNLIPMLSTWPVNYLKKYFPMLKNNLARECIQADFFFKSDFINLGSFSRKSCNGDSVSPLLSRVLPSEVEVLESIYLDELQVMKGNGRYIFS